MSGSEANSIDTIKFRHPSHSALSLLPVCIQCNDAIPPFFPYFKISTILLWLRDSVTRALKQVKSTENSLRANELSHHLLKL